MGYAAAGNGGQDYHWVSELGWCWDFDTMMVNSDGIPREMNRRQYNVWWYNSWNIVGECCQPGCVVGVVADGYKCIDKMITLGRKNYYDPSILQMSPSWAHGWSKSPLTATWKDLR